MTAAVDRKRTKVEAEAAASRIVCRSLTKHFYDITRGQEIVALEDVDLAIADNEFITILGPSGCGKTTLLNIAAGFEFPTSGEILLDNQAITGPAPDRGVVFQEYALFPWLTVLENIEFGLRERGVPRAERAERTRQQILSVGLTGFEDRYPHELSGGMRQRVALARVMVNDPKSLLMDEPFAALDAQTRTLMQGELLSMWSRDRRTVLFITHNIEEAIVLGDRVAVMTARPGRIKEIVVVELPRPRDVTSQEFNQLRRRVAELVEEESKRAFADAERASGD